MSSWWHMLTFYLAVSSMTKGPSTLYIAEMCLGRWYLLSSTSAQQWANISYFGQCPWHCVDQITSPEPSKMYVDRAATTCFVRTLSRGSKNHGYCTKKILEWLSHANTSGLTCFLQVSKIITFWCWLELLETRWLIEVIIHFFGCRVTSNHAMWLFRVRAT